MMENFELRLSVLLGKIRLASAEKDPEIRVVNQGGFSDICEILNRNQYYNENILRGITFEKGDFVSIELVE